MTEPNKSVSMMLGETLRTGGALLIAAIVVFSNRYTWLQIGGLAAASLLCVVVGIIIECKRRT
jgi:hypothetical protein